MEQKLLRKRNSACKKTCRYIHKELRTVGFAFFHFSMIYNRIYKFTSFGNKKEKKLLRRGP